MSLLIWFLGCVFGFTFYGLLSVLGIMKWNCPGCEATAVRDGIQSRLYEVIAGPQGGNGHQPRQ